MSTSPSKNQSILSKSLTGRHVQLIALGCAVGTGLYLGTADSLKLTGPSVLLGYLVVGFIIFLIMRQLGEMVVEEPEAGSFSHFADKYWGAYAGFVAGWNSWILYILISMAELAALGKLTQFWFPNLPTWLTILVCFLTINAFNLINVKAYAETEFWMSSIKVVAVIGMILFGSFLLLSGSGSTQSGIANLWQHEGGFFPGGLLGFGLSLSPILFAFGGLELVGVAAAEAKEPKKVIPKAVNQTILILMFFYIESIFVLLTLFPWNQLIAGGSPFVLVFSKLGNVLAANALNIIVFSAALSVYNSCVYASSRMLFSLAEQKNAPQFFAKLNKKGVPFPAVFLTALVTFACVILNYLFPDQAFSMLMTLSVSCCLITWAMISLSHLKFKAAMKKKNITPSFKAILSPASNYFCILFMIFILFITAESGQLVAVALIPAWLLFLGALYLYKKKYNTIKL